MAFYKLKNDKTAAYVAVNVVLNNKINTIFPSHLCGAKCILVE
jgi:hypothetical protein